MKYEKISPQGCQPRHTISGCLYSFYSHFTNHTNIYGKDTKVVLKPDTDLASLLERHNKTAVYDITFSHPTTWENNAHVKDTSFIPLMEAQHGDIVSFCYRRDKNITMLFPQIENKSSFLTDLLEKVLPGISPALFPFSTQFAWLNGPDYQLPNEEALLQEKASLETEYDIKVKELDCRTIANRQKYSFLHELLTQSGHELVKTVEKYLRWLGFKNVDIDDINPDLKEEDLRVEDDRGMLVIEVKGIGGTSTDSECSQISKIRYRRSKERREFDVFALYIVNHQRYLPPANRTNPPFNAKQIEDAENDQRGLITTFELFKLYFNVMNGYISKNDAQKALYKTGLVSFRPSGATEIPGPYEIHHRGCVVIFKADDLEIKIGDNSVESAREGEIGVKLSESITGETYLWLAKGN